MGCASLVACSRVTGGLWTEQKNETRHHERLRRCRQMFLFDDIHVTGDQLALPVLLREVEACRNRLPASRREAMARREDVRGDRIQAMRRGLRLPGPQRETTGHHPPAIASRF